MLRVDQKSFSYAKDKIIQIVRCGSEVRPAWRRRRNGERFFQAFDIIVIIENDTVVTVERLDDINSALYGNKEFINL